MLGVARVVQRRAARSRRRRRRSRSRGFPAPSSSLAVVIVWRTVWLGVVTVRTTVLTARVGGAALPPPRERRAAARMPAARSATSAMRVREKSAAAPRGESVEQSRLSGPLRGAARPRCRPRPRAARAEARRRTRPRSETAPADPSRGRARRSGRTPSGSEGFARAPTAPAHCVGHGLGSRGARLRTACVPVRSSHATTARE